MWVVFRDQSNACIHKHESTAFRHVSLGKDFLYNGLLLFWGIASVSNHKSLMGLDICLFQQYTITRKETMKNREIQWNVMNFYNSFFEIKKVPVGLFILQMDSADLEIFNKMTETLCKKSSSYFEITQVGLFQWRSGHGPGARSLKECRYRRPLCTRDIENPDHITCGHRFWTLIGEKREKNQWKRTREKG